MQKLNMKLVQEDLQHCNKEMLPIMQTAIFVMVGGDTLGRAAAEQPADFYIDDRCGRLPYSKRSIMQAVNVLVLAATAWGFDPHHLPEVPSFYGMGTL